MSKEEKSNFVTSLKDFLGRWAMDNRIPEYEFNYALNKYESNPELLQQVLGILKRPVE